MATLNVPVNEWLDLVVDAPLLPNVNYRFQNVGSGSAPIELIFADTEPDISESGFVYEVGEPVALETLVYDGTTKVWIKAQRVPSRITVRRTV